MLDVSLLTIADLQTLTPGHTSCGGECDVSTPGSDVDAELDWNETWWNVPPMSVRFGDLLRDGSVNPFRIQAHKRRVKNLPGIVGTAH